MSFADRRLHMIGIGGAGMSALATVAYAWGAEVIGLRPRRVAVLRAARAVRHPGLDRARPRASASRGWRWSSRRRSRRRAGAAWPPATWRCPGSTGPQLLAEMVASRRSICVAGAHGKTTTSP